MSRRLFYAIEFSETTRQKVAAAGQKMQDAAEKGRWTRPDNLHLTLQFLGECPDEWLPELLQILKEAASSCQIFNICIQGCGTFGRNQDILWLGVQSSPALCRLAGILAQLLQSKQLPYEDRPFSPHVTIGRQVKISPDTLQSWVWPPIDCRVDQISLMESVRIDDRLVYRPIERSGCLLSSGMCDNNNDQ